MQNQSLHPDVRIGHVHLRVADLDRATAFYRDVLGFSLIVDGLPFGLPMQRWPLVGAGSSGWLVASTLLYLSLIPLIPLVFVPRGRVFDRELRAAAAQGVVTSGLQAAFHDRVVAAAHVYELLAVGVIIALMVMKPF